MALLLQTKSLDWDDVNILAQEGKVKSRSEVPIEGRRIVVSGMTSIIGPSFIKAVAELPEEYQPTLHIVRDIFQKDNLKLCKELGLKNIFVGVGFSTTQEDFDYFKELDYTDLLLDIANGYLPQLKDLLPKILNQGFVVCTGSVHTVEGVEYLASLGVKIIRVGIAKGSVCITKVATGVTRGTFTEIYELSPYANIKDKVILADGGIKSPADFVKAFLTGADYVMAGRPFVEALECRMHQMEKERAIPNSNHILPKSVYFGQASEWGKVSMGKTPDHIEGKLDPVKATKYLKEIITTIWDGIRSGVSYSGYKTLTEAIGNGVFESKI